jgi:hypothetical protein
MEVGRGASKKTRSLLRADRWWPSGVEHDVCAGHAGYVNGTRPNQ